MDEREETLEVDTEVEIDRVEEEQLPEYALLIDVPD